MVALYNSACDKECDSLELNGISMYVLKLWLKYIYLDIHSRRYNRVKATNSRFYIKDEIITLLVIVSSVSVILSSV